MKKTDVALMKPPLTGGSVTGENPRAVARIKETDGTYKVSVAVCGLKERSGGDYYFFLEGNVPPFFQMFDLSGGEFSVYDRDAAGATGIFFVTEKEAFIDLYGTFSADGMSEKEALGYAQTYFFNDENAGGQASVFGEKKDERAGREKESYDDEMIAEENYYEYADVDAAHLKVKDDNCEENENVGIFKRAGGEQAQKENASYGDENEEGTGGVFFEKIRANLNKIFCDYPSEKSLGDMVCGSKWVKISYDGERYYVVGVIYSEGAPEYVCYGVPGNYADKPDELKGRCSFIPASPYALKREGYWVVFQKVSG